MTTDSIAGERRSALLRSARHLSQYRTFFGTALRHPKMVGAATPTSPAVASTAAQVVPTTGDPVVLELGPGTGSMSEGIHRRLPTGARHIGIELGAEMVDHLRAHKPWMEVVHGDARNLQQLLDGRGVDRVDAVVSSIPWSLLTDDEQDAILAQITRALTPEGAFTAVAYLHAERSNGGKRFRQRLQDTFDEVVSPVTWRNLPPIVHYVCRRPLTDERA